MEELAEHGVFLPPNMQGLTDEQLEILSTLCLTQTSCGTVTAGLVPDIPTADGSPKLVWLQEAPVSVLNQIWKQTHSLSYQSTEIGAGRSQLSIRNDCLHD